MAEQADIGISGFNGDADYYLIDPTHREKHVNFLGKSIAVVQEIGAHSRKGHHKSSGGAVGRARYQIPYPRTIY